jgi:hypothetical protein
MNTFWLLIATMIEGFIEGRQDRDRCEIERLKSSSPQEQAMFLEKYYRL